MTEAERLELHDEVTHSYHTQCDGCIFMETYSQSHPYGSTTAIETMDYCNNRYEDADDCPAFVEIENDVLLDEEE